MHHRLTSPSHTHTPTSTQCARPPCPLPRTYRFSAVSSSPTRGPSASEAWNRMQGVADSVERTRCRCSPASGDPVVVTRPSQGDGQPCHVPHDPAYEQPVCGRSRATIPLAARLTLLTQTTAAIPLANCISTMLSADHVDQPCGRPPLLTRLSSPNHDSGGSPSRSPMPPSMPEPQTGGQQRNASPSPSTPAPLDRIPRATFHWSAPDRNVNALWLQPGWSHVLLDDSGFQR